MVPVLYPYDLYFVGTAGFEPATSSSQNWRDNRTTLRSENSLIIYNLVNLAMTLNNYWGIFFISFVFNKM